MQDSIKAFQKVLKARKNITVLTGAGISAESGIPTFRGEGGLWRNHSAFDLATPEAFYQDPGLVWEFYGYRRDLVSKCAPNPAHYALATLEKKLKAANRGFNLFTQTIDGFHQVFFFPPHFFQMYSTHNTSSVSPFFARA